MESICDKILEIRKSNRKAVLCTVVSTIGSTPRKIGSKMIVTDEMKIFGTIGGGALEKAVMDKSADIMNKALPELLSFNLSKDLGMVCGGSVDVFVEPLFHNFKLFIFGAGHIGKALSKHLKDMNFDIHVIDERENIFSDYDHGSAHLINSSFSDFIKSNSSDDKTFIVVATISHSKDLEILKGYVNSSFAYLGVIGSKRKAVEMKNALIQDNLINDKDFEKIDIPMGLDILAEGPEEIAISIASKLILEKNKISKNISISN